VGPHYSEKKLRGLSLMNYFLRMFSLVSCVATLLAVPGTACAGNINGLRFCETTNSTPGASGVQGAEAVCVPLNLTVAELNNSGHGNGFSDDWISTGGVTTGDPTAFSIPVDGAVGGDSFDDGSDEEQPTELISYSTIKRTPEPSSYLLLGSGLFAVAGLIRRRMTF
jgi:hypothetical protein